MANRFDPTQSLFFDPTGSDVRRDEDGVDFVQFDDMRYYVVIPSTSNGEADGSVFKPKAMLGGGRWPGHPIRVVFDGALGTSQRDNLKSACGMWSGATGLRFTEDGTDEDCIYFQPSGGNDAPIGYGRGLGKHRVNIASWGDIARIAHEIGHVLGLEHEHQRSDALEYIELNEPNLKPYGKANFKATNGKKLGDYDLLSIMHYDPYISDPNFVFDPSKPAFTLKPAYASFEGKVGIKRISSQDALAFS